jgi:hypothetical protein
MVASGPQKYPGASTANWYEGRWPGDRQEVNVVVLHTTEGTTLPTYDGGAVAPNFTAVPDLKNKKLVWYQHFYVDTSSRALVNKPGGVQTNTNNVCQVELVGTCDPKAHVKWSSASHIYWPQAPEWALRELAKFLAWMNKNHDIPLVGPSTWLSYPDSYGSNKSRMNFDNWNKFRGICGHQHVPENDHGDPGSLDFATLVNYTKEILNPPKDDGGDKPTTPAKEYYAFPGAGFFKDGKKDARIAAMHKRLVAEGVGKYKSNSNQDTWGSGDEASYKAWQQKLGYKGDDADGIPGKVSWDKLKVPKS